VSWGWIEKSFERVAQQYNPLLTQLIVNEKLKVRLRDGAPDSIDIRSAELIAASLTRRRSLCVVFPDVRERRSAFVFAYALLSQWDKARALKASQQAPVLYCGVRPGIREQLSNVSVTGLSGSLSGIFDQIHLARGAQAAASTSSASSSVGSLPRVVTAYGPGDPVSLISNVKPSWIAIDLGDAPSAPWIEDLLKEAKQRNVPVIGWSTNPLSDALQTFRRYAQVISWPMSRAFEGVSSFGKSETAEMMFQPFMTTSVSPIVLSGSHLNDYNTALLSAVDSLRRIPSTSGLLAQNAIRLHWRLLRTIEGLSVPLDFYNAEAPTFWGTPATPKLVDTCRHFQASLSGSDRALAQNLDAVLSYLDDALTWLSNNETPLWSGLCQIIHQEANQGLRRALTFSSRSRKELFLLALLARLNVTSSELDDVNAYATSVTELAGLSARGSHEAGAEGDGAVRLVLAGLPTLSQMPRLLPVFFAEDMDVLIHRYQGSLLAYSVREWDRGITPNLDSVVTTLCDVMQLPRLDISLPLPKRVKLAPSSDLDIKSGQKRASSDTPHGQLWEANDLLKEIGYLLETDEDTVLSQDVTEEAGVSNADGSLSIARAIELTFDQGWCGLFDPAQLFNFIAPDSHSIQERYVRALRVNDNVLVIPHQRRQSLYSLIMSRVHQHASIEVHLALLKRWHEDFRSGYQRWSSSPSRRQRYTPILDQFLEEMRKEGSVLTSALAIRFWLEGTTLSPIDPNDLMRVANILDLRFVREQHRKIDAAAKRIRGLHRGLANKLNRWLEDRARGLAETHDNEVIDSSLGLTFGEIRESFVILKVEATREIEGPFLSDALGMVQRRTST